MNRVQGTFLGASHRASGLTRYWKAAAGRTDRFCPPVKRGFYMSLQLTPFDSCVWYHVARRPSSLHRREPHTAIFFLDTYGPNQGLFYTPSRPIIDRRAMVSVFTCRRGPTTRLSGGTLGLLERSVDAW